MRNFETTVGFILSKSGNPTTNTIASVEGYSTVGDGGAADWKHNGVTGQTVSQSPAQLGDALLNDASGNQWSLVSGDSIEAKALGVLTDGADMSGQLLACKVAAGKVGANVKLPFGVISFASLLVVDVDNVSFIGHGSDRSHDVGGQGTMKSTGFKWIGALGGDMMRVSSPTGGSNQKLSGGGVQGVYFIANSLAATGLTVISRNKGFYSDLHFEEFTGYCFAFTAHALGEAADPQLNLSVNITFRQINKTGRCLVLDGIPSANTSMNTFNNLGCVIKDGDAIDLSNCDNNLFLRCRVFRASGGVGNAIIARGSNSSVGEVARSNLFLHFSSNNVPIIARGTTSFTHASHDNRVIMADMDNSTPIPTIEAGATFWFDTDKNMQYNSGLIDVVMGSTRAQVDTARSNLGTETIRVKNDSDNHIVIESGNGSSEWGMAVINSTGNIRFNRLSGSGGVEIPHQVTLTSQTTSTTATAGVGTLPATPQGFFEVTINGTVRKIPFYV